MPEPETPASVVEFWAKAGPASWFAKNADFDRAIKEHFEPLHHAAARRELDHWASNATNALALILLLDQFPRNLYRGSAHAFATDGLALHYARQAISAGFDLQTQMPMRIFFYLPLEHAEDLEAQQRCLSLMEATGDAFFTDYARIHLDTIAKFGRFPHRNNALGRMTTPTEQEFLKSGGFSG